MAQAPIVSLTNVVKVYGALRAVDDVSLTIREGEAVALLGPNGAGKTTLLEMIEGLQSPDSGTISIAGMNYDGEESAIRRLMGLAFQETRFPEKIKVIEALELFAAFYSVPQGRVKEILQDVDLVPHKNAYVNRLSGGQRQRLALGVGVIQNPKVLLLDEPSTGLDPHARRSIWKIVRDLKKNGSTILLTTHYMEEAEELCDRIVILFAGKILADGSLKGLLAEHASHEIIEFKLKKAVSFKKFAKATFFTFDPDSCEGLMHVEKAANILPEFLRRIGQTNLESFAARPLTLDDLFIKMTGRHLDE